MGRPSSGKTAYFGPFRIRPEDSAEIKRKAKAEGITLSDFVIFSCLGANAENPVSKLERVSQRVTALEQAVERLERLADLGGF